MSEELNPVVDPAINGSEQELELEPNPNEEKVEPQNDETVPKSQYNQVFARTRAAEEKAKVLQAELEKYKKPTLTEKPDDITSTVKRLELAETKRQYGYEHGLSPEETDFVFKISPKPSKETLDDVAIKGALQAIRAKKKVSDNTPKASRSAGFQFQAKKGELTAGEKQAEYEKRIKERLN